MYQPWMKIYNEIVYGDKYKESEEEYCPICGRKLGDKNEI